MINKIINKEYEIKILNSLDLREKIMKDNNLTDLDIFNYFYLKNTKDIMQKVKVEDIANTGIKRTLPKYAIKDRYIGTIDEDSLRAFYERNMLKFNLSATEVIRAYTVKKEDKDIFSDNFKTEKKDITINEYFKQVDESKLNFYNKTNKIADDYYENALENSFIVINETSDGKYQLIDGFYRLLYKKINREVVVKIYKNLTDSDWMNLMISCNTWKIDNISACKFFDRGFVLGLCNRFNIDKNKYYSYKNKNIIIELKEIVSILKKLPILPNIKDKKDADRYKEIYSKANSISEKDILLSKYFIKDFIAIGDIINYVPYDEVIEGKDCVYLFSFKYISLLNLILACIKYIRTLPVSQKNLSLNIFKNIMNTPNIIKIYKKINELSVGGYIENFLNKNIMTIYDVVYNYIIEK